MAWWKRNQAPLRRVDQDAQRELEEIRARRRERFRILVCIDGSDESYEALRMAKDIGSSNECDIILLFVRPIDQGLRSGGLQMRVARENMLEWGLELPGIQYLKRGLDMLVGEDRLAEDWELITSHTDIRGDPLGDNKIEYVNGSGKSVVLKLKTAPDPASGILDQYELGPYNVVIMGNPSRWRGEIKSVLQAGVVQKVAMLSPCSVLVAREQAGKDGFLICTDGSEQCLNALRQTAVLAKHCAKPITLMGVARTEDDIDRVDASLQSARSMLDDIGINTRAVVSKVGDPVERIVETGSNYELITVSDSGKSRVKRFLAGSVAFDVMGASARSVLNVR